MWSLGVVFLEYYTAIKDIFRYYSRHMEFYSHQAWCQIFHDKARSLHLLQPNDPILELVSAIVHVDGKLRSSAEDCMKFVRNNSHLSVALCNFGRESSLYGKPTFWENDPEPEQVVSRKLKLYIDLEEEDSTTPRPKGTESIPSSLWSKIRKQATTEGTLDGSTEPEMETCRYSESRNTVKAPALRRPLSISLHLLRRRWPPPKPEPQRSRPRLCAQVQRKRHPRMRSAMSLLRSVGVQATGFSKVALSAGARVQSFMGSRRRYGIARCG